MALVPLIHQGTFDFIWTLKRFLSFFVDPPCPSLLGMAVTGIGVVRRFPRMLGHRLPKAHPQLLFYFHCYPRHLGPQEPL